MRRAEGQRQLENDRVGFGDQKVPSKPLTPKELEERRQAHADRAAQFFPEPEEEEKQRSLEQ